MPHSAANATLCSIAMPSTGAVLKHCRQRSAPDRAAAHMRTAPRQTSRHGAVACAGVALASGKAQLLEKTHELVAHNVVAFPASTERYCRAATERVITASSPTFTIDCSAAKFQHLPTESHLSTSSKALRSIRLRCTPNLDCFGRWSNWSSCASSAARRRAGSKRTTSVTLSRMGHPDRRDFWRLRRLALSCSAISLASTLSDGISMATEFSTNALGKLGK